MERFQYIQLVREYVSLTKSTSTSDYGKIVKPQYEKLKAIALENGFDLDNIYKEVTSIQKKYGMRDKIISNLRSSTTNPITEDLCEAMLEQFINEGRFNIRTLDTKESRKRGLDDADENTVRSAELESLKAGLNIFINNIRNGNLDKVSSFYYKKIQSIGLEKLERFLQTGERTPELNDFLNTVYNNAYSSSESSRGDSTIGHEHSLHAYENKDEPSMFRFYFNMPKSTDAVQFIRDYQVECQNHGIDYTMKPFKNMNPRDKDTTIFYSSYKDLSLKVQIIKELVGRYPSLELGTPPAACAQISGLANIGFCHNGVVIDNGVRARNFCTYNDYIDNVSYLAFIHVFGMHLSSISPELAVKIEKVKNGECRHIFTGMRNGRIFSQEDRVKVQTMIKKLLSDPLKRKVFIKQFKSQIQKCHNINQGYAHNLETNIALDMPYIDAVKEPERNTQRPGFSPQRVASALMDGIPLLRPETDKIPE